MFRRRFLLVCTAVVTGLWFRPSGLTQLSRSMVIALAGRCSFCGKEMSEVRTMARALHSTTRICDECVGLCLDILDENIFRESEGETTNERTELDDILRDLARTEPQAHAELEDFIANIRAQLDGAERWHPPASSERRCSFCDRQQDEVKKLIAGPQVFICDACTGEAATITQRLLET